MSTPIKDTAPQFIAKVLRAHINHQGELSAATGVDTLIGELYPDQSPQEACHALIINAVDAKIEEIKRNAASDTERWVTVGQLSLFGSDEFKIPPSLLPQSIAMADDYMAEKARAEQGAADALAQAWNAQVKKAKRVAGWSNEVRKLRLGVEAVGLDPSEVSIEQAIKQAETLQSVGPDGARSTSKRPVRTVRNASRRGH